MLFMAYLILVIFVFCSLGLILGAFKDRWSVILGFLCVAFVLISVIQAIGVIGLLPEVTWR